MKLKHIFYTAAAMAMLSFQACTLDEDTSGISNPDDFFRKFSECQSDATFRSSRSTPIPT